MKDVRWIDDVKQALKSLGGKAHLSKIYGKVREIREQRKSPLGEYEAWVRYTLQQNSRGRGQDLFEPFRIRSGIWLLKKR